MKRLILAAAITLLATSAMAAGQNCYPPKPEPKDVIFYDMISTRTSSEAMTATQCNNVRNNLGAYIMPKGTPVTVSRQDVINAFQQLYNQLDKGYWAPSTTDANKDMITEILEGVSNIITGLNQEDIESRDTEFKKLAETVNGITPRLDSLGKEIDNPSIHQTCICPGVCLDSSWDSCAHFYLDSSSGR